MALGSTQPLTEMSTRGISWGKGGRCVRLTTYHHLVSSRNLGALTSWNPLGLSRPVMGLLYLLPLVKSSSVSSPFPQPFFFWFLTSCFLSGRYFQVSDSIQLAISYKLNKEEFFFFFCECHLGSDFLFIYWFILQSLLVSSDYDQKEQLSRNFLRNLGPFSEPILVYQLGATPQPSTYNVTFLWVDPAGHLVEVSEVHMEDGQVVRINVWTFNMEN